MLSRLSEGGVFVDIGTGRGIVPRLVKKLGIRAVTVDSPAAAGTSAIENAALAGVEGHLCNVGQESLPFENEMADCVFFADVIEHLIHSPKPVSDEIRRVLKPGGVCARSPPATNVPAAHRRRGAESASWSDFNQIPVR